MKLSAKVVGEHKYAICNLCWTATSPVRDAHITDGEITYFAPICDKCFTKILKGEDIPKAVDNCEGEDMTIDIDRVFPDKFN